MHFVLCDECEGVSLLLTHGSCCSGEDITVYPNSTDADQSRHIPKYEIVDDRLYARVDHLMEKNNRIDWIYLETSKGGIIHKIPKGEEPKTVFDIRDEQPIALYAYCVKHGVWKVAIE